jgi:hypothetical protein
MRVVAMLASGAILWLLGCSSGAVSPVSSTTSLTSAEVSTGRLDAEQVASILRRMQRDQRVLAELARTRADDVAVRALGRQFALDNAEMEIPPPARAPHASPIEDELVERDVSTELRLAEYGGHTFDRAFLAEDRNLLERDLALLKGALASGSTDPALKAKIARLAALVADELHSLEEVTTLEIVR